MNTVSQAGASASSPSSRADAVTDGGPRRPEGGEPDLRDAAAPPRQVDRYGVTNIVAGADSLPASSTATTSIRLVLPTGT
jgi:hypothetical protein